MTLLNNNPINHVDSRESHLWSDESQLIHSIPGAGRKVSDGMRQRLAVVMCGSPHSNRFSTTANPPRGSTP